MRVTLTRAYRFSASHRLDCGSLSPEKNRAVYGKCNNPHGHGHNYRVEVSVVGAVDRATGMLMNLAELDAVVQSAVVTRFHLANLNVDPLFTRDVFFNEKLCRLIYTLLSEKLPPPMLQRVRIEETENNFFEYAGES